MIFLFFLSIIILGGSCADRKYGILLSDTHIGGDWFTGTVAKALPKFLRLFTQPDTEVHTLFFVGDLLDFWMRNYTEYNPTVVELLKSENFKGINVSEYVSIFNEIMDNDVRIVYVRGNHDNEVEYSDLVEVGLSRVEFYPVVFSEANFEVEHGNRFDLFNAPDPYDPISPFGYIITRSYSEAGNFEVDLYDLESDESPHSVLYWICSNILVYTVPALKNVPFLTERIIGGALGEKAWDEIINPAYKKHEKDIVKNGCVYTSLWSDEELKRIVQKYSTIIERTIDKYGTEYTEGLVKGMCHDHSYFIKQIQKDLYIQGHTHSNELEIYTSDNGKKIVYGNTGMWTIHSDEMPFLRITQNEPKTGNVSFVELMTFDDETSEFRVKKQSKVPYNDNEEKGDETINININNNPFHTTTKWDKIFGENFPVQKISSISPKELMIHLKKEKRMNETSVPDSWICDKSFYNSNDGCDCNCGAIDPDCACSVESTCAFSCCSNN